MKRSAICIGALLLFIEKTEGAISSHPSKFDHIHIHEHHQREDKRRHENRRAVEQAIYEYQQKIERGEIDHEAKLERHRIQHRDVHKDTTEELDLVHNPHGAPYYDPYGRHPDDPEHENYMDHLYGTMTDEELEALRMKEAAKYGEYHDPMFYNVDDEL